MCRKCGESDRRGSAKTRRQRRRRLLEGAGGVTTGGNGTVTGCVWCEVLVGDQEGYLTVTMPDGTVKRLPVRRMEQDRLMAGGPYSLWNLVASCGPCNRARVWEELEVADGCLYGPETLEAVRLARAERDVSRRAAAIEEASA